MRSKRTRIERMMIINFGRVQMFEIACDQLLTLLEGENGIGKSTILISSFICHMPDKSTFAFRNQQGEKTGMAEVVGRMPESGAVWITFQAVDWRGDRLLYGVMMRKTGLNKVDIVPFLIDEFGYSGELADIFVTEGDNPVVRTMPEVIEYLQLKGLVLRKPAKLAEYLHRLTEFGIHSGDMTNDRRRRDYADVILSCMYGGISKDIGSRIREFLLPELPEIGRQKAESQQALVECQKIMQEIQEFEEAHRRVSEFSQAVERMLILSVSGMWRVVRNMVWGPTGVITCKREAYKLVKEEAQVEKEWNGVEIMYQDALDRQEKVNNAYEQTGDHLRLTREAFQLQAQMAELTDGLNSADAALVKEEDYFNTLREQVDRADQALTLAKQERTEATDAVVNSDKGVRALLDRRDRYRTAQRLVKTLRDQQLQIPASKEELLLFGACGADRAEEIRSHIRSHNQALDNADDIRKSHAKVRNVFSAAFRNPDAVSAVSALVSLDKVLGARKDAAKKAEGDRKEVDRLGKLIEKRRTVTSVLADAHIPAVSAEAFHAWLQNAQEEKTELATKATQAISGISAADAERQSQKRTLEELEKKKSHILSWREKKKELQKRCDPFATMTEARAVISSLQEKSMKLRSETHVLEKELEDLTLANQFLTSACVAPWLSDLCRDVPDACLVPDYLDSVPITDSARIEAALGPLARGILVDSPAEIANELAKREVPETVWFSEKETISQLSSTGMSNGNNVVVHAEGVSRISPLPSAPLIGKEARERERERNELRMAEIDRRIVDIMQEVEQRSTLVTSLELLLDGELAFAELPTALIETCRLAIERETRRINGFASERDLVEERQNVLQPQIRQANSVAVDASVLDEANLPMRLSCSQAHLLVHSRHAKWYARIAPLAERDLDQRTRMLLGEQVLSEEELAEKKAEIGRLSDELTAVDTWRKAAVDLAEVFTSLDDSASEKEAETAEQRFLQLKTALELAVSQEAEVEKVKLARDGELDKQRGVLESGRIVQAKAFTLVNNKKEEIAGHKIGFATEADIEVANKAHHDAAQDRKQLQDEMLVITAEKAVLSEKRTTIRQNKQTAVQQWKEKTDELKKQNATYKPMKRALEEIGRKDLWKVASSTVTDAGSLDPYFLLIEASAKAQKIQVLMENLTGKIPREQLLYDEFADLARNPNSTIKGRKWITAYRQLILWLSSFYPSSIIGAENPTDALGKIDLYIPRLKEKYETSQQRLRETAQKVTQEIRKAMRSEKKRIRDMNDKLEHMAFGSISGITLHVQDNPDLMRFLDVMERQMDLFGSSNNLTIDEVLEETYRSVAKGSFTAEELLDYRKYLSVEVKMRRAASGSWEMITGSTGESIGVGTAIFIVIFDAWEEDGRKRRKDWSPMRYLVIDEASRLSESTLKAIMNLAADLDVNILAACPEAPFMGKATAYHLELDKSDPGSEKLVISGRFLRSLEAA